MDNRNIDFNGSCYIYEIFFKVIMSFKQAVTTYLLVQHCAVFQMEEKSNIL